MFKNVASQKIALFAFDTTTSLPKTGDGANLTPYVSKDYGTVTVLGTTTATEMDATNAKGWYSFVLTQAETNADALLFSAKSTTANISIVGSLIYSTPPNFSTLVIDGSGRGDISKIAGTSQTARDIGASVLISSGTGAGQLDVTSGAIKIQTSSKKNQSLSKFEFVMTDSTTHAPATGKTVSITRSIDGGAFGAGTLGAVTELSNGVYYTDIPAADMNGNVVTLRATASGADDLFVTFTLEP